MASLLETTKKQGPSGHPRARWVAGDHSLLQPDGQASRGPGKEVLEEARWKRVSKQKPDAPLQGPSTYELLQARGGTKGLLPPRVRGQNLAENRPSQEMGLGGTWKHPNKNRGMRRQSSTAGNAQAQTEVKLSKVLGIQ